MKKLIRIVMMLSIVCFGLRVQGGFIQSAQAADPKVLYVSDSEGNWWSSTDPFTLADVMPGSTYSIEYEVHNVGPTAAGIYHSMSDYEFFDTTVTEPECMAESGTWTNPAGPCNGRTIQDELDRQLRYTLTVELYTGADVLDSTQHIYTDADNKLMHDVEDEVMTLGAIPSGWYMKVYEYFYALPTTGNEFQGDKVVFDVNFVAEDATLGATTDGEVKGGQVLGAATGSNLRIAFLVCLGVVLVYLTRQLIRARVRIEVVKPNRRTRPKSD